MWSFIVTVLFSLQLTIQSKGYILRALKAILLSPPYFHKKNLSAY